MVRVFQTILLVLMALSGLLALDSEDSKQVCLFGTAGVLFLMSWAMEITMK